MYKLFFFIFILFVTLQIVTEWSCLDTLLPVCIPWMYHHHVVFGVFLLSFVVNPIRKHFLHKKKPISDSYEFKIAMVLIIVPAIVFLPNRYIPIEPGTEYQGETIALSDKDYSVSYGENVDAIIDGLMDNESDGGGFEPDEENYDPDKVPAGGDVYGDDFDD